MLRPCLLVAAALLAVSSAARSDPHFTDATAEAGLLWYAMTWGAVAVDVDEDDDLDLLSGHHFSSAYLHTNDGAGHFTVWGLPQIVTFPADRHGFLWSDLDGDGFADAYCVHGGEGGCANCETDPAELWRSLGDGLFAPANGTALADSLARGRAASAADIDGDGDLDIHVSKAPQPLSPNALFRNDGSLSFVNVAADWGIAETEGTVGSLFADVDEDGDPDLLVGGEEFSRPTVFWRNDGGHFTDATFEAFGELPVIAGADFGDFDGDRDLDLVVCEGSDGVFDAWQATGNNLWFFANHRFGEDGVDAWTFRTPDGDPTASFRINGLNANEYVYLGPLGVHPTGSSVVLSDAYVGAPAYTAGVDVGIFGWRDEAGGKWEIRVSAPPGAYGNFTGQLVSSGPFTEIVAAQLEQPALSSGMIHLYRNEGGVFTEVTSQYGFTPSLNPRQIQWVDYDNDGDLDLHLVNKGTIQIGNEADRLWRNDGTAFTAIDGEAPGIPDHLSDGGVWADFDQDGDLDLFLQEGTGPAFTSLGAPSLYYRNEGPTGHWLRVDLENPTPGQTFVGTRVTAYAANLVVHQRARADSWRGFQAPAELHFGLGEQAIVDSLVIEWPNGETQRRWNVAADQLLHVGGEPDPTGASSLNVSDVGNIYPQPSHGMQYLGVDPAHAGALRVRVFDVRGSLVREIFHGEVASGAKRLEWDGRDSGGRLTAPGIYFWRGEGAMRFERRAVRTR